MIVVDRKRETGAEYRYEFASAASPPGASRARRDPRCPPPPPRSPPTPTGAPTPRWWPRPRRSSSAATCSRCARPGHARALHRPGGLLPGPAEVNPAPYEFLFNLGEGEYLVGASPEMFVRVTGDRVETCPISGTIGRGGDPLEDAEPSARSSQLKDESELTMCTDVDRNDKSRVCVPGSVKVIGRRQIEMYSRLIHTVDHIEGRLRPGFDALDAFLTHMWAVTVTGAPKTWAMQFIEDHEDTPRRWYGGAVGFVGFDGSMNTGLTLRTAQIRDGVAAVRAGATLLYDSDPDAEERETDLKARALLGALAAAGAPAGAAAPSRAGAAGRGHEGAARRPRGLLRQHPGRLLPPAGRRRRHAAPRLPRDDARRDRARPRRALARARLAVRLRPAALLDALYARTCRSSGSASACRPWSSTRAASWTLLAYPSTASPARSGGRRRALLDGLPEEFTAARYHSLHAKQPGVDGFTVTALTPTTPSWRSRTRQAALRGAVPPRVDPHRRGRRGRQDRRQRAAPVPYLCVKSREVTPGRRRCACAEVCGRTARGSIRPGVGGDVMRGRRAALRASRHGARRPARPARGPALPRGAPRRSAGRGSRC